GTTPPGPTFHECRSAQTGAASVEAQDPPPAPGSLRLPTPSRALRAPGDRQVRGRRRRRVLEGASQLVDRRVGPVEVARLASPGPALGPVDDGPHAQLDRVPGPGPELDFH